MQTWHACRNTKWIQTLTVVATGGDKYSSVSELCVEQTNRGDPVWVDILQGSLEVKQQRV